MGIGDGLRKVRDALMGNGSWDELADRPKGSSSSPERVETVNGKEMLRRERKIARYFTAGKDAEVFRLSDVELDSDEEQGAFGRPLEMSEIKDRFERKEILERTAVEGKPVQYRQDEEKVQLTPKLLEEAGLGPAYKVRFDDAEMALSKCFQFKDATAAIAYVKGDDDNYHARAYYQSNSQGVWRFMPDYDSYSWGDDGAFEIGHFGKGYSEEAVTLPADFQCAIGKISAEPWAKPSKRLGTLAFVGTTRFAAKIYDNESGRMDMSMFTNSYYDETSAKPIEKFRGSAGEVSLFWCPPEEMRPGDAAREPDFSHSIREFRLGTKMYGDVEAKTFLSKDGDLLYTFLKDRDGRAWIGHVEYRCGTNSAGVRREWVRGGNLTTPLYEYDNQCGKYGDRNDELIYRDRHYVGMWKNYLSQVPMIKEFLRRENN